MESKLYQPLDTSVPEIRLFSLFPSSQPGAPVAGQLQVVPLGSPPPYECLSYAWGAPEFIKPIIVNGQTLLVTPNLDGALRALRQEKTPRLLWIDAICINQGSLVERGHQVTLMRTIYSHCERDLLWLGPNAQIGARKDPGEDALGEGMQLLARIAGKDISVLGVMGRSWTSRRRRLLENELPGLKELEKTSPGEGAAKIRRIEEELASLGNDDETTDTLNSGWLLSHEEQDLLYQTFRRTLVWDRLWVMQELALAPKIQLVAGRHTLDWDVISGFLGDSPYADAFHGTFGHSRVEPAMGNIFKITQKIDHQRRIMREVSAGRQASTLLDVLARFRDTQSSDLRDKIYGLLGLVSDGIKIEISYEITHQKLFTNVSVALINELCNLDIICQRPWTSNMRLGSSPDDQDNLSEEDRLPSWAADFSQGGEIHLFAQRSIFTAGRPSCEVPCCVMNEKILRTRGMVLGRVGQILQQDYPNPSQRYYSSACIPLEWLELYLGRDAPSASSLDDMYMTGEPTLTAFWRTLILDCAGYPMIRLTQEQVEEEDTIIKSTWLQKANESTDPKNKSDSNNESFFTNPNILQMWRNIYSIWTFSITENGLYVLLMPPAKEGDIIACLDGGKVPVVLRPLKENDGGEENMFRFINVAYVHGLMDFRAGESAGLHEKLGLVDQEFWLV